MNKEIETVGRWVKASERLPENQRYLNLRWTGKDGSHKQLAGNWYPAGYFNTPLGRYEKNEIEWLEETPAILLTKEEWEGVQEKLDLLTKLISQKTAQALSQL